MSGVISFPRAMALAVRAAEAVRLGLSVEDALDSALSGEGLSEASRASVAELLDRIAGRAST